MEDRPFSDGEKLILRMLCILFKRLDIRDPIDPDLVEDALSGHSWALSEMVGNGVERPEYVNEVYDILGMWRNIEQSYDRLSDEEKSVVKKETGFDVRFEGFDGNNEGQHHSTALFIVNNKRDGFEEFEGRDLNAHAPVLEEYRDMFERYKEIATSPGSRGKLLTADHLIELLGLDDLAQITDPTWKRF